MTTAGKSFISCKKAPFQIDHPEGILAGVPTRFPPVESCSSANVRLAPETFAPSKLAPVKSAWDKSKLLRSTWARLAFEKSELSTKQSRGSLEKDRLALAKLTSSIIDVEKSRAAKSAELKLDPVKSALCMSNPLKFTPRKSAPDKFAVAPTR